MLHFNNLTFYAVPSLPIGWKPPTWLTIELGILAGRLYFEFDEYRDMRKYLDCGEDSAKIVDEPIDDAMPSTNKLHEHNAEARDSLNEEEERETSDRRQAQSFTAKPLMFLQEWLAMRRKGQEFTHTPMGYVCQGKPLAANHPFFNRLDNDGAARSGTAGGGARTAQGRNSVEKGNIGIGAVADTHADPNVASDLDYPEEEDYFVEDEDEDENENEDENEEQEDGMFEENDRSESDEESPVEEVDESDDSDGPRQWSSALSELPN